MADPTPLVDTAPLADHAELARIVHDEGIVSGGMPPVKDIGEALWDWLVDLVSSLSGVPTGSIDASLEALLQYTGWAVIVIAFSASLLTVRDAWRARRRVPVAHERPTVPLPPTPTSQDAVDEAWRSGSATAVLRVCWALIVERAEARGWARWSDDMTRSEFVRTLTAPRFEKSRLAEVASESDRWTYGPTPPELHDLEGLVARTRAALTQDSP